MIDQYPDTITIAVPAQYEQDIDTGSFVKTELAGELVLDCRAETGGEYDKGNNDAKEPSYSFTIYTEPLEYEIKEGAAYVLVKKGKTYRGNIKGSMNNEFNTVLWG